MDPAHGDGYGYGNAHGNGHGFANSVKAESPASQFVNFKEDTPDGDNLMNETGLNSNTGEQSITGNMVDTTVNGANSNFFRGLNNNILGYGALQNFHNLDDMLAYNPANIVPNEGNQLLNNLNINITSPSTQSPLDNKDLQDLNTVFNQDFPSDTITFGDANNQPQKDISAINAVNMNNSISGANSNYPSPMNILSNAGSQNYTMANGESVSSNNDNIPTSISSRENFQGSQDFTSTSLRQMSTSFKPDAFSPQSLGFSTNFLNNKLGTSISNTLGKSYGSHLGSSLNNLISPSSTYDGFTDSPYGSYNDDSFRSPMNSPSLKSIGSPLSAHVNSKSALSKESKLSRRRELHNAVERRRRDLIKEKIKELGSLIPPAMLNESSNSETASSSASNKTKTAVKEVKANKNIILAKTVEYIRFLQSVLEAQDKRLDELRAEIEHLDLNDSRTGFSEYGFADNNGDVNHNVDTNKVKMEYDNNNNAKDAEGPITSTVSSGPQFVSISNFQSPNGEEFLRENTDSVTNFAPLSHQSSNNIVKKEDEGFDIDIANMGMPEKNQFLQDPEEMERLQSSLSAFMEDVELKTSNSKLKFMDFSNIQSEPMDFRKLSQSLRTSNDNNENIKTENIDSFLRFTQPSVDDTNDIGDGVEEHGELSLADEFTQTSGRTASLAEPSLKFANDADFLDQLLSREPETKEY